MRECRSNVRVIEASVGVQQRVVQVGIVPRVRIQGRQVVGRQEKAVTVRIATPPRVSRVVGSDPDQLGL